MNKATQITTAFNEGKKSVISEQLSFSHDNGKIENEIINIYPSVEYQSFDFFGGAITEAVGIVLASLPENKSDEILNSVFGSEGLRYRAVRTHIDSCDFSLSQYCAMDCQDDKSFSSFKIERDEKHIIPWILKAYRIAGCEFPVMLSPWSPPSFMKTNGSRTDGGYLKKEYYNMWAEYICRYILEYKKHGVNVQSISIQNEPNASQIWDSCLFTPEQEKDFIETALFPCLIKADLEYIGIYIWDHNKERAFDRAVSTITDGNSKCINGIAVHWYSGDHFDALSLIRDRFPDKKIIFTEGCIEYSRYSRNEILNAQKYAHDLIGNMSHGLNGFLDWNICLDSSGGPNYVNNLCEAPIMCSKSGNIEYKLSYDYIGHFTKHIIPGAKRIATTKYTDMLDVVAFKNPDNSIVLIVLNRADDSIHFNLRFNGYIISTGILGQSISTVIIK